MTEDHSTVKPSTSSFGSYGFSDRGKAFEKMKNTVDWSSFGNNIPKQVQPPADPQKLTKADFDRFIKAFIEASTANSELVTDPVTSSNFVSPMTTLTPTESNRESSVDMPDEDINQFMSDVMSIPVDSPTTGTVPLDINQASGGNRVSLAITRPLAERRGHSPLFISKHQLNSTHKSSLCVSRPDSLKGRSHRMEPYPSTSTRRQEKEHRNGHSDLGEEDLNHSTPDDSHIDNPVAPESNSQTQPTKPKRAHMFDVDPITGSLTSTKFNERRWYRAHRRQIMNWRAENSAPMIWPWKWWNTLTVSEKEGWQVEMKVIRERARDVWIKEVVERTVFEQTAKAEGIAKQRKLSTSEIESITYETLEDHGMGELFTADCFLGALGREQKNVRSDRLWIVEGESSNERGNKGKEVEYESFMSTLTFTTDPADE
ncbi:hypothetical protein TREMEDRAFT_58155 [Tremella mesenterica DSM 1558]|uniref:uncharacterized protein n=1 Tax=Tremella mesenterica (strain ATCC 24925 / CBS 8224 / DSM 1558 / NBRC 9311 / NRRL Y-6157 / RJB 2259-6 / UBC 559-6) TaxID=578456 RepID=UPI0003F4967D|nr:uncharacterized protein TREMEDRAFT_58155 [Tremella mesenterica DSM 1558]EIW72013.1 hypothetical protein TREMEDRAFT_58155 [Tremella mesenterica DSM 1558]